MSQTHSTGKFCPVAIAVNFLFAERSYNTKKSAKIMVKTNGEQHAAFARLALCSFHSFVKKAASFFYMNEKYIIKRLKKMPANNLKKLTEQSYRINCNYNYIDSYVSSFACCLFYQAFEKHIKW
jgi:hypothetical protein